MSSGCQEFYTVAQIAVRKVKIWPNAREDAVQYIVMKLWEDDLDRHITFKKLVTYACNKARDYLRELNGRAGHKSKSAEVLLEDNHLQNLYVDPRVAIFQKLDLQKTMSPMLEDLIVKGTTMKEYGKTIGVSESRVSQLVDAEVTKLRKKLK